MKRITYFLSGALAALLISSATVSAFAAGGLITLNVQPAQVMVNGEVFQPKDAQGRDALAFALLVRLSTIVNRMPSMFRRGLIWRLTLATECIS